MVTADPRLMVDVLVWVTERQGSAGRTCGAAAQGAAEIDAEVAGRRSRRW